MEGALARESRRAKEHITERDREGLGFRVVGFRGLGFRGLGFRV